MKYLSHIPYQNIYQYQELELKYSKRPPAQFPANQLETDGIFSSKYLFSTAAQSIAVVKMSRSLYLSVLLPKIEDELNEANNWQTLQLTDKLT